MSVRFSPSSSITSATKQRTVSDDELALRRAYLQRVSYLRRREVFYNMLKQRLIRQPQSVTVADLANILMHLLHEMKASDANELRAWGHIISEAERKNGLR